MKSILILFIFIVTFKLYCTSMIETNLVRLQDNNYFEGVVNQMSEMGVNFFNSQSGNKKLKLDKADLDNVKIFGAVENTIQYKIEDKNKIIGYNKKWFDINIEETKYLLDKRPLFDEIKLDDSSHQLSIFDEDPSIKYNMNLMGPLNIKIEKDMNPVFELPKRLEINSKFKEIVLDKNTEISLSNINSISLSKPIKINTLYKDGMLHFDMNDIPTLFIKQFNNNTQIKISSKEKTKLKINDRQKTAMIQSTNTISSQISKSSTPLFTNKMIESYLEVAQKLNNKSFKFTEITEASIKNIRLIQIPAKLKQIGSDISTNFNIFLAFDYNNLYVTNVSPSTSPLPLVSFPSHVNQTFGEQIFNFLSNNKPKM